MINSEVLGNSVNPGIVGCTEVTTEKNSYSKVQRLIWIGAGALLGLFSFEQMVGDQKLRVRDTFKLGAIYQGCRF